jgi:hypothetical protein
VIISRGHAKARESLVPALLWAARPRSTYTLGNTIIANGL